MIRKTGREKKIKKYGRKWEDMEENGNFFLIFVPVA